MKDDSMINAPKQDRSRATQQKLMATTIRLISAHGLAATTVSRVANEAGISRGATQHHFATREALIRGAVERIATQQAQWVDETFNQLVDEQPSDHDILARVLAFFTGELFHASVQVWTGAAAEQDLRATIVSSEAKSSWMIYKATARALRADTSDAHTREVLRLLLDSLRGIGLSTLLSDHPTRLNGRLEALVRLIGNPDDGIKRLPVREPDTKQPQESA